MSQFFSRSLLVAVVAVGAAFSQWSSLASAWNDLATREQQIDRLIRQLGDDSFHVREQATESLIRMGLDTRDALTKATKHADAEIRARSKRLLVLVAEAHFRQQLEAFAADVDGKKGLRLPGWERFSKLVGTDQTARQMFVEMQQADPKLMLTIDQGPKAVEGKLAEMGRRLRDRGHMMYRNNSLLSASTVAGIVFAASDPAVNVSDEAASYVVSLMHNQAFQQSLKQGDRVQISKKLAGQWVGRTTSLNVLQSNVSMAMQHDLKEAVTPTISYLKKGGMPVYLRQMAVLLVAKLGDSSHVEALQPLLKDTESINHFGPQRSGHVQVRDAALLASLKLNGLDPKDFGFWRLEPNPTLLYNQQSVGFSTTELREAAMKKYELTMAARKAAEAKDAAKIAESKKAIEEINSQLATAQEGAKKVMENVVRPRMISIEVSK